MAVSWPAQPHRSSQTRDEPRPLIGAATGMRSRRITPNSLLSRMTAISRLMATRGKSEATWQRSGGIKSLGGPCDFGGEFRFLAAMYPKAVNADIERSILVPRLIESYTFASAHDAVAQLSRLHGFTADQARSIAKPVLNNSQVKWIAKDADMESLLKNFLTNREDSLEPEIAKRGNKVREGQAIFTESVCRRIKAHCKNAHWSDAL